MSVLELERLEREGLSVKIQWLEVVPMVPAVQAEQCAVDLDLFSKPLAAVRTEAAGAFGCDCKLDSQPGHDSDMQRSYQEEEAHMVASRKAPVGGHRR